MNSDLSREIYFELRRLARQQAIAFQAVLDQYACERLLYRLSKTEHASNFVLKGAMLLVVWTGNRLRATRDMDLRGLGAPTVLWNEHLRSVYLHSQHKRVGYFQPTLTQMHVPNVAGSPFNAIWVWQKPFHGQLSYRRYPAFCCQFVWRGANQLLKGDSGAMCKGGHTNLIRSQNTGLLHPQRQPHLLRIGIPAAADDADRAALQLITQLPGRAERGGAGAFGQRVRMLDIPGH